ncbi:MAG: hypothetical protein ACE1Z1_01370, partial [Candidatus Acidiferrales bacterium]
MQQGIVRFRLRCIDGSLASAAQEAQPSGHRKSLLDEKEIILRSASVFPREGNGWIGRQTPTPHLCP